jgi:AraC-like DNA-binding protein
MQMILKSLGECTHSTAMRRIFLETGVLQLLLMQLELLSSRQKTQRAFLKSHDVQRIQYVKLLMEDNIRNPGTLVELAHKAGLNDFKLKKGFKELYNITVFGYLHELRMHKARQLLAEEKRSVREVADTVGYKNPHHFSSAFKKKFGILPGQLNK